MWFLFVRLCLVFYPGTSFFYPLLTTPLVATTANHTKIISKLHTTSYCLSSLSLQPLTSDCQRLACDYKGHIEETPPLATIWMVKDKRIKKGDAISAPKPAQNTSG